MVSQEMRWCLPFAYRRLLQVYHSLDIIITDQLSAECSLVRCVKCKTPVKDTDAVLDAVRVGQEALDKATDLQFSSTLNIRLSHPNGRRKVDFLILFLCIQIHKNQFSSLQI